jgi:hypothetical protein
MRNILLVLLCAPALTPAHAHHSFAMFDPAHPVTLNGTVKDFQWVNPHAVLWVYAAPDATGLPVLWTIELTSPGNLSRSGWTRHVLNPGDRVTVEIAPLRSGAHGGAFRRLTLTDSGKTLTSEFSAQEKPGLQ